MCSAVEWRRNSPKADDAAADTLNVAGCVCDRRVTSSVTWPELLARTARKELNGNVPNAAAYKHCEKAASASGLGGELF